MFCNLSTNSIDCYNYSGLIAVVIFAVIRFRIIEKAINNIKKKSSDSPRFLGRVNTKSKILIYSSLVFILFFIISILLEMIIKSGGLMG